MAELVLVRGVIMGRRGKTPKGGPGAVTEHAAALGVRSCEWLDGSARLWANRALRRMRGTAPPVDAVEIVTLDRVALQASLDSHSGRALWREAAGCGSRCIDSERSFILMGESRLQLEGPAQGQRVIWLGNGLAELDRQAFIDHYTKHHGPLVAGYADLIGLRRYRQVPDEEAELCAALRDLGLGRASPPAVFGELFMGTPPFTLSALRARRAATREIAADEKRHIDFSRSMLLLAGPDAGLSC